MPLVIFFAGLFIEVLISSYVAGEIGGVMMFVEIIASAMLGFSLLFSLGAHMRTLSADLMARRLDEKELVASSASRLVAGILLIIPGIFSDLLGLFLLLPFVARGVLRKFVTVSTTTKYHQKGYNHDVIDVEVSDDIRTISSER